jgi:hypothetical protein
MQLPSHDVSHKRERTQISGPSGPAPFRLQAAHGPLSLDFTGPNRTQLLLKPIGLHAIWAAGAADSLPQWGVVSKEGRSKPRWTTLAGEVEARTSANSGPGDRAAHRREVSSP